MLLPTVFFFSKNKQLLTGRAFTFEVYNNIKILSNIILNSFFIFQPTYNLSNLNKAIYSIEIRNFYQFYKNIHFTLFSLFDAQKPAGVIYF